MDGKPKAIIIGSGLSGMTAAIDLGEAGYDVHVFEKRHIIGGRTSSWNENGMMIESGLHRFLGMYTELPRLLKKVDIDLDEMLCWEDEIEIRLPDGPNAVFGASILHKPVKTVKSALGHSDFYSLEEKLALGKMFAAGLKDYKANPTELDGYTVLEYAVKHGVPDRAVERILKPLTEGIFFMPIQNYSAYNFIGLFAPFIPKLYKVRVGAFMGGMTEIMMQPLARYVTEMGGRISVGANVGRIEAKAGKVQAVWVAGVRHEADCVVLAASLTGAQNIIRQSFPREEYFADMLELMSMPAVTVQLDLAEPALDIDRTTFGPTTSLVSFSEQSRTTFRSSTGRLSVILATPEHFIERSDEAILQAVSDDAMKIGIDLSGKIKDYRVVRLPGDFYSLQSGSEALRPEQRTSISGLALAGDYTKQKYLATMEGAVVSGHAATDAILSRI